MIGIYEREFSLKPRVFFNGKKVFRVKGFLTEGISTEEFANIGRVLENLYSSLPFSQEGRFIVIGKAGDIFIPKAKDKKKDEFLRRYEKFLKEKVNVRKISIFFIWNGDKRAIEDLRTQLKNSGIELREGKKELFKELSYFFGGDEEDPFWYPIEEWDWGVKVGDRYGAVLVNVASPAETQVLHLDFLNRIADDFIFVLNFRKIPSSETSVKLENKITLLEKQQRESKQEIARELQRVLTLLEKGEESITEYTAFFAVFSTDEKEAYERGKAYEFQFKQLGLEFALEGTTEIDAFLSLFRWDRKKMKELGYLRTILSSAFSYMLPMSSLPEGAKEGAVFFTSGLTPFYLDLYHTPPPNATVLGQMGSGKSVFLQYLSLFQDYVVFIERIHESEGSYTVFTKTFDGNYYPISLDRPVSVAPFGDTIYTVDVVRFIEFLGYRFDDFSEVELNTLRNIFNGHFFDREKVKRKEVLDTLRRYEGTEAIVYYLEKRDWEEWEVKVDIDRDKLVFLKTILSMMYSLGTGKEIDPAVVEDIILRTYQKHCNGKRRAERELLMRDFYETAKELKLEELAKRFKSYTLEGAYGYFFDRPSDLKLAPYVFFELRTNDKEILPLIVISILTNVVKWFSRPEMGNKRKGVILDEAWFFTGDEAMMKFVEEALRTYRKKGIFIVLASQLAKDFGEGAGEVIKSTCPYNIFLYSDITEHDNIARVFKFNELERELLRTIKRPKDYDFKFSKFYMRTPYEVGGQKVKGIFHLIPSREFYWIATTHPADKVKREEYRQRYKDLAKAIEMLARDDEG